MQTAFGTPLPDNRSIQLWQLNSRTALPHALSVQELSAHVTASSQLDRCLEYIILPGGPVHMYLEVDADRSVWCQPTRDHPRSATEEQYMEALVSDLKAYFESHEGFQRPMDSSGLLLLQASTPTRIHWRVHLPCEAFQDAQQHRIFVQSFMRFLEVRADESADAREVEYDRDIDDVMESQADIVTLCRFDPKSNPSNQHVHASQGRYHHILRHLENTPRRSLLAPYNHVVSAQGAKGSAILRVRTHTWDADGNCHVIPESHSSAAVEFIDPAVLQSAHPALSLPTAVSYQLLCMHSRKRAHGSHENTDDDRSTAELDDVRAQSGSRKKSRLMSNSSSSMEDFELSDAESRPSEASGSRDDIEPPVGSSIIQPTLTHAEWHSVETMLSPFVLPSCTDARGVRRNGKFPPCTVVRRRPGVSLTVQLTSPFTCPVLRRHNEDIEQLNPSQTYPNANVHYGEDESLVVRLCVGSLHFSCSHRDCYPPSMEIVHAMRKAEWGLLKCTGDDDKSSTSGRSNSYSAALPKKVPNKVYVFNFLNSKQCANHAHADGAAPSRSAEDQEQHELSLERQIDSEASDAEEQRIYFRTRRRAHIASRTDHLAAPSVTADDDNAPIDLDISSSNEERKIEAEWIDPSVEAEISDHEMHEMVAGQRCNVV